MKPPVRYDFHDANCPTCGAMSLYMDVQDYKSNIAHDYVIYYSCGYQFWCNPDLLVCADLAVCRVSEVKARTKGMSTFTCPQCKEKFTAITKNGLLIYERSIDDMLSREIKARQSIMDTFERKVKILERALTICNGTLNTRGSLPPSYSYPRTEIEDWMAEAQEWLETEEHIARITESSLKIDLDTYTFSSGSAVYYCLDPTGRFLKCAESRFYLTELDEAALRYAIAEVLDETTHSQAA